MSDHHVTVNRDSWDEDAPNWVERGREAWASQEPVWGRGNLESEDPCGARRRRASRDRTRLRTAFVAAWLMRRGDALNGLDNSSSQLGTARTFQEEFALHFPLVHADAERAPFADGSFDFAISQYGAAHWCDPIGDAPRPRGSCVPAGASCSRRFPHS